MNKNTEKNKKYNSKVISALRDKYGLSLQFIYLSLAGHRTSETAEKLKKEYHQMDAQIQKILNPEVNL